MASRRRFRNPDMYEHSGYATDNGWEAGHRGRSLDVASSSYSNRRHRARSSTPADIPTSSRYSRQPYAHTSGQEPHQPYHRASGNVDSYLRHQKEKHLPQPYLRDATTRDHSQPRNVRLYETRTGLPVDQQGSYHAYADSVHRQAKLRANDKIETDRTKQWVQQTHHQDWDGGSPVEDHAPEYYNTSHHYNDRIPSENRDTNIHPDRANVHAFAHNRVHHQVYPLPTGVGRHTRHTDVSYTQPSNYSRECSKSVHFTDRDSYRSYKSPTSAAQGSAPSFESQDHSLHPRPYSLSPQCATTSQQARHYDFGDAIIDRSDVVVASKRSIHDVSSIQKLNSSFNNATLHSLPATTSCFSFSPTLAPAIHSYSAADQPPTIQPLNKSHNGTSDKIISSSHPNFDLHAQNSDEDATSNSSPADHRINLKSALRTSKKTTEPGRRREPHSQRQATPIRKAKPEVTVKVEAQAEAYARQWRPTRPTPQVSGDPVPDHQQSPSVLEVQARHYTHRYPHHLSQHRHHTSQRHFYEEDVEAEYAKPRSLSQSQDEMLRHRRSLGNSAHRCPPALKLAPQSPAMHERHEYAVRERSTTPTSSDPSLVVDIKKRPLSGHGSPYGGGLPYGAESKRQKIAQIADNNISKNQGSNGQHKIDLSGVHFANGHGANYGTAKASPEVIGLLSSAGSKKGREVFELPTSKDRADIIVLSSGSEDDSDTDVSDDGGNDSDIEVIGQTQRHALPAQKPAAHRSSTRQYRRSQLPGSANTIISISSTGDDILTLKEEHIEASLSSASETIERVLREQSLQRLFEMRQEELFNDDELPNTGRLNMCPIMEWSAMSPAPDLSHRLGPQEMSEDMETFLEMMGGLDQDAEIGRDQMSTPVSGMSSYLDKSPSVVTAPHPGPKSKQLSDTTSSINASKSGVSGSMSSSPKTSNTTALSSTARIKANSKDPAKRKAPLQKPNIFMKRPTGTSPATKMTQKSPTERVEPEFKRPELPSPAKGTLQKQDTLQDPRSSANTASPSNIFDPKNDPRGGLPQATPSNMFGMQAANVKFDPVAAASILAPQQRTPPVAKMAPENGPAFVFEDTEKLSAKVEDRAPYPSGVSDVGLFVEQDEFEAKIPLPIKVSEQAESLPGGTATPSAAVLPASATAVSPNTDLDVKDGAVDEAITMISVPKDVTMKDVDTAYDLFITTPSAFEKAQPGNRKAQTKNNTKHTKKPQPRFLKPMAGDDLLIRLREENTSWVWTQAEWQRQTGQAKTVDGLRKRYKQLLTIPVGSPTTPGPPSESLEAAQHDLTSGVSTPSEIQHLYGARHRGKHQGYPALNAIDLLARSPTAGYADVHPTVGGKQLNQAAWDAMWEAILEDEVAEEEEAYYYYYRETSPFSEKDKVHFEYRVRHRFVDFDEAEDDVEWRYAGRPTADISTANNDAAVVLGSLLQKYGRFKQQRYRWDDHEMAQWEIDFGNGTLFVQVSRALRSYQDNKLPENKQGWVNTKCFVAIKKTTVLSLREQDDNDSNYEHEELFDKVVLYETKEDINGEFYTCRDQANREASKVAATHKPRKSMRIDDVEKDWQASEELLDRLEEADESFDESFVVGTNKTVRVWVEDRILKGPRNV